MVVGEGGEPGGDCLGEEGDEGGGGGVGGWGPVVFGLLGHCFGGFCEIEVGTGGELLLEFRMRVDDDDEVWGYLSMVPVIRGAPTSLFDSAAEPLSAALARQTPIPGL